LIVFSAGLTGCQVQSISPTAEPNATPTPTNTPTATIIWFPPTSTPSPFPTPLITPTLDIQPSFGGLILADDFSSGEAWQLAQTRTSSVAMGKKTLTLALDQANGYLFTLRTEPQLSDFYLEITASTSLCRGADEYGLLLRVTPALEFYRFSLSCDGRTRLDKYFNKQASSPQPWIYSGAVPPGAPGISRLGVWANGRELRFYINDELQFEINDPSLTTGSLGLFIRSAGDNALTVSFSDLNIREPE
jgi:hypothetical protein